MECQIIESFRSNSAFKKKSCVNVLIFEIFYMLLIIKMFWLDESEKYIFKKSTSGFFGKIWNGCYKQVFFLLLKEPFHIIFKKINSIASDLYWQITTFEIKFLVSLWNFKMAVWNRVFAHNSTTN